MEFWHADATGQMLTQKRLAAELARAGKVYEARRLAAEAVNARRCGDRSGDRSGDRHGQAPVTVTVTAPQSQSQSQSHNKMLGAADAATAPHLSDEDWLTYLQTVEAYKALDVKGEYSKMVAWCGVNSKNPSRKRFINWLNRAEKPMTAGTTAPPAVLWSRIKTLEEKIMLPALRAREVPDESGRSANRVEADLEPRSVVTVAPDRLESALADEGVHGRHDLQLVNRRQGPGVMQIGRQRQRANDHHCDKNDRPRSPHCYTSRSVPVMSD
jgi:hypothetical protein